MNRTRGIPITSADDGKEIYSDEVLVVDEDLSVIQKTRIGQKGMSFRGTSDLEAQKMALVDEIQDMTRDSNIKREAMLKLAGLMKTLDPLLLETKEKVEILRLKLASLKKQVTDEEALRLLFLDLGLDGSQFMDKGSKMKANNFKDTVSSLKNENLDLGRDVEHRCQGYGTETAKYRDDLRAKLFDDPMAFKKQKLNINEKLQDDFRGMNDGIDYDGLINPTLPTKKPTDHHDHPLWLVKDIEKTVEESEGAKALFDEMCKNMKKKDPNEYPRVEPIKVEPPKPVEKPKPEFDSTMLPDTSIPEPLPPPTPTGTGNNKDKPSFLDTSKHDALHAPNPKVPPSRPIGYIKPPVPDMPEAEPLPPATPPSEPVSNLDDHKHNHPALTAATLSPASKSTTLPPQKISLEDLVKSKDKEEYKLRLEKYLKGE